jgi:putative ABC transport system permease protein
MSWLDGLAHRVRTLLHPHAYERDLESELQHHIDLDTLQVRDAYRARRRFGNRTYYAEETRRMTWLGMLDVVEQDARSAWRSLKRNPSVAVTIIVTFALGIGVNSATFTLLDRIYLRPPAGVVRPGDVHRIWIEMALEGGRRYAPSMTYPMYRVIREAWGDSGQVALVTRGSDYYIGGTRRGAKVDALFATASYWPVLGLKPQLGRFYNGDEDRVGNGAAVVVLSDHLWRAEFGADSAVIGRPLRLGEERYTIIGVAPRGFAGDELDPVDVWIPLASHPQPPWMKEPLLASNGMQIFQALARARPNANLEDFARRATRDIRAFNGTVPIQSGDSLMKVTTGSIIFARGPGQQSQEHLISTRLSAVAIIVLVITVANVVNLLLARATRRRREIAVRLALGVGRWRLVRMLTGETLLLALVAAVAAVLTAWWGGTLLRALLLPGIHFLDSAVDARVIVFTFAIAATAGLVAGFVPALQASNLDLTRSLKEGAREGLAQRSHLRDALVVMQAALSVVLLAGAALFVQSLRNVRGVNIGYDSPRVVIGSIDFDAGRSPSSAVEAAQMADVARRVGRHPGVRAVARAQNAPMWGYSVRRMWIGSDSNIRVKKSYPVLNSVTREFFAATGLRLLRGSVFADLRGAPTQVVINQAMAEQLWSGVDPMGQCIRFDGPNSTCYAVAGIVETARRGEIIEDPVPQYYLPMSNMPATFEKEWSNGTVLLVRAAVGSAAPVEAQLRQELRQTFPTGYPNVRLLSDIIEPQYRPWRVGAMLFSGFGALALVVAIVGIFSTVSYGVSQRTHEFGVRIALGARVADVLRLVLGDGMRTVFVGVVVGIALAIAAGRLIGALLYGITPSDPMVLLTVSLVLLLVAAAATLLPAWRAARVDPIKALRAD